MVLTVGATFGGAAPPTLASDPSGSLLESAVSPDGTTLAVVVTPNSSSAGGYIALYSMTSMTTGQLIRQLTNGTNDEDPAWSPKGTQLVFRRRPAALRSRVGRAHVPAEARAV